MCEYLWNDAKLNRVINSHRYKMIFGSEPNTQEKKIQEYDQIFQTGEKRTATQKVTTIILLEFE